MEDIGVIYRERRYWLHGGWRSWFEACPVVRHTVKGITVVSLDYPSSPLYPGGEFVLGRGKLLGEGKVYHSRHGEWFWLDKPSVGDLFPSADVIGMPSALQIEARSLGWDLTRLSDRQLQAYLMAIQSGIPLAIAALEIG